MTNDRHEFGSAETERKLSCLRQYLSAFCAELKNQSFYRVYIDAFAGTGSRTETHAVLPFFDNGTEGTVEVTTPGSARIALELEPGFDTLYLIEQDPIKVAALLELARNNARVHVRQGDANGIVQKICKEHNWIKERMRGVIFLDPYGMEVSWDTVLAIGQTEALDCWYFFPLSGLYRNSPRDPRKLDGTKIEAINRVFGTDRWRREWYVASETQIDLFNAEANEERSVTVDQIESWIRRRLRDAFKGDVLEPLRLYHPSGAPMASLFFAISNSNPKAIALASRIASHILKAGISSQKRPR